MSIEAEIVGNTGQSTSKRQVHVHPFETATGTHQGLVSLTYPLLELEPEFHPFLNESFGTAMNQNVSMNKVPS